MIYFAQAGTDGHVKIGWTRDERTLAERIGTLQTGQPYRLAVIRTLDAPHWAEAWLHGFFAGVRATGEWFAYQPEMLDILPPDNAPCGNRRRFIPLTMPATMKAALDQFCADRRRATGQPSTRGEVIRDAIAAYLAAHSEPPCDP